MQLLVLKSWSLMRAPTQPQSPYLPAATLPAISHRLAAMVKHHIMRFATISNTAAHTNDSVLSQLTHECLSNSANIKPSKYASI